MIMEGEIHKEREGGTEIEKDRGRQKQIDADKRMSRFKKRDD